MEEDIDTILERRTKIVLDDRSDHSPTFSKTAFKAKRNFQGQEFHHHDDDIDVDDPDFWKKILGNHIPDKSDDSIHGKRPRRPVDYRQQIHFESDSSFIGDYCTDDAFSM
jgi:hypothetical protein